MKNILFVILAGILVINCSKSSDGGEDTNFKINPEQKDQLMAVTRGLGDMEIVSERYKEDQGIETFSAEADQQRLKQIFSIIESDMKDEGCELVRKASPDPSYDHYAGVEFRGDKCPMVLMAETARTDKKGAELSEQANEDEDKLIREIVEDKNVYYRLRSEELTPLVDVKNFMGQSQLKLTIRKSEDNLVKVDILNEGGGQGSSQRMGDFDYDFRIERTGLASHTVKATRKLKASYTFKFSAFTAVLRAEISKDGDQESVKKYFYNDQPIDQTEFSTVLGTIPTPEKMIAIEI